MTIHTWLAFVATSLVVLAIPGPTALIILRYATEGGRGRIARVIAGAVLGDVVALTICNLGLGALLATSSELLAILKAVAAAYLIGLGLVTLFGGKRERSPVARGGRPFTGVFLVSALNPKGIAFFCALLPQFVDGAAPVTGQLAILQVTFCSLSLIAACLWAMGGLFLYRVARDSALGRHVRRGTGLLLIGTGIAQATGRLA